MGDLARQRQEFRDRVRRSVDERLPWLKLPLGFRIEIEPGAVERIPVVVCKACDHKWRVPPLMRDKLSTNARALLEEHQLHHVAECRHRWSEHPDDYFAYCDKCGTRREIRR